MNVKYILCFLLITSTINAVRGDGWNFLTGLVPQVIGYLFGGPMEPEVGMSVPEIIEYYGYPAEVHTVITKDGYIETLHRIPHGKNNETESQKCPAVLMIHGLLCTSAVWVWNTPNKSLAYQLADMGHDVWLGNYRGNEYSMNHTNRSIESDEFWDFSFDEVAEYDIPAWIDYILLQTGCHQVWIIGHSMGGTGPFAMLASKPEYNEKVKLLTALAPGFTLKGMKSPLALMEPFRHPAGDVIDGLFHGEFSLNSKFGDFFIEEGCAIKPINELLCKNAFYAIVGPDHGQLDKTRLNLFLTLVPSSSSVRTISHIVQHVDAVNLTHYDFGPAKNYDVYKQPTPPIYNVTAITTPVALLFADNDWLVNPINMERLKSVLQHLILYHQINYTKFSHMDMVWAIDENDLVNNPIIDSYKTLS